MNPGLSLAGDCFYSHDFKVRAIGAKKVVFEVQSPLQRLCALSSQSVPSYIFFNRPSMHGHLYLIYDGMFHNVVSHVLLFSCLVRVTGLKSLSKTSS